MAVSFDTLSYAKRLRAAGVPEGQADAHAEAALYLFRAVSSTTDLAPASVAKPDSPASTADLVSAVDGMTREVTACVGGIIFGALLVYALLVLGIFSKPTPPI